MTHTSTPHYQELRERVFIATFSGKMYHTFLYDVAELLKLTESVVPIFTKGSLFALPKFFEQRDKYWFYRTSHYVGEDGSTLIKFGDDWFGHMNEPYISLQHDNGDVE